MWRYWLDVSVWFSHKFLHTPFSLPPSYFPSSPSSPLSPSPLPPPLSLPSSSPPLPPSSSPLHPLQANLVVLSLAQNGTLISTAEKIILGLLLVYLLAVVFLGSMAVSVCVCVFFMIFYI